MTVFPTDLDQLLLLFLFACFLRSGLCCSGRSVYLSHRNVYSPTSSQTWRTGHTGSTRVSSCLLEFILHLGKKESRV